MKKKRKRKGWECKKRRKYERNEKVGRERKKEEKESPNKKQS